MGLLEPGVYLWGQSCLEHFKGYLQGGLILERGNTYLHGNTYGTWKSFWEFDKSSKRLSILKVTAKNNFLGIFGNVRGPAPS